MCDTHQTRMKIVRRPSKYFHGTQLILTFQAMTFEITIHPKFHEYYSIFYLLIDQLIMYGSHVVSKGGGQD